MLPPPLAFGRSTAEAGVAAAAGPAHASATATAATTPAACIALPRIRAQRPARAGAYAARLRPVALRLRAAGGAPCEELASPPAASRRGPPQAGGFPGGARAPPAP